MKIRNLGLSLLSMLALAAFVPAQRTISFPSGSPTPGETTTVAVSDPESAGDTVVVSVVNGDGEVSDCVIQLDENGEGSEDFDVPPKWEEATFSTGDASVFFLLGEGKGVSGDTT